MEVFRQTEAGTILDSLRIKPDNLEVTRTARARKRLQSQVRVLRHYDGAEIMDPENMVPSSCFNLTSEQQRDAAIERLKLERMLAVAMATHDRLGKHSPLHDLHRAEDCLKLIRTYVKKGYDALDLVGGRLSDCALAHWPIVQSLSEEQLAEFYELACIERWGESEERQVRVRERGCSLKPILFATVARTTCQHLHAVHTLVRTHTNTITQARSHTRSQVCTYPHTSAHQHTHTHTHNTHTNKRTHTTHTETHTNPHAHMHAYTQHRVHGRRHVQLRQLLSTFEGCENCRADGRCRSCRSVAKKSCSEKDSKPRISDSKGCFGILNPFHLLAMRQL